MKRCASVVHYQMLWCICAAAAGPAAPHPASTCLVHVIPQAAHAPLVRVVYHPAVRAAAQHHKGEEERKDEQQVLGGVVLAPVEVVVQQAAPVVLQAAADLVPALQQAGDKASEACLLLLLLLLRERRGCCWRQWGQQASWEGPHVRLVTKPQPTAAAGTQWIKKQLKSCAGCNTSVTTVAFAAPAS